MIQLIHRTITRATVFDAVIIEVESNFRSILQLLFIPRRFVYFKKLFSFCFLKAQYIFPFPEITVVLERSLDNIYGQEGYAFS